MTPLLWCIAYAWMLSAWIMVELVENANRWADTHPEENWHIAAAHERQDWLEGRHQ